MELIESSTLREVNSSTEYCQHFKFCKSRPGEHLVESTPTLDTVCTANCHFCMLWALLHFLQILTQAKLSIEKRRLYFNINARRIYDRHKHNMSKNPYLFLYSSNTVCWSRVRMSMTIYAPANTQAHLLICFDNPIYYLPFWSSSLSRRSRRFADESPFVASTAEPRQIRGWPTETTRTLVA